MASSSIVTLSLLLQCTPYYEHSPFLWASKAGSEDCAPMTPPTPPLSPSALDPFVLPASQCADRPHHRLSYPPPPFFYLPPPFFDHRLLQSIKAGFVYLHVNTFPNPYPKPVYVPSRTETVVLLSTCHRFSLPPPLASNRSPFSP